MKHILFLLLITSTSLIGQETQDKTISNFDKGKNLVGLQGGFGSKFISTNLRYGKYIADKTSVGLNLKTQFDFELNGLGVEIGPYFRYNFLDRKFSPLIEANQTIGYYRYGPYASSDQIKTSFAENYVSQLQTGFQWTFYKGFGLDVLIGGRFRASNVFNYPDRTFKRYRYTNLSGEMRLTYNF